MGDHSLRWVGTNIFSCHRRKGLHWGLMVDGYHNGIPQNWTIDDGYSSKHSPNLWFALGLQFCPYTPRQSLRESLDSLGLSQRPPEYLDKQEEFCYSMLFFIHMPSFYIFFIKPISQPQPKQLMGDPTVAARSNRVTRDNLEVYSLKTWSPGDWPQSIESPHPNNQELPSGYD